MQLTSPSSSPSQPFVPSMPLNEGFAASHSRGQCYDGFGANGDLEMEIGDGRERAGKRGAARGNLQVEREIHISSANLPYQGATSMDRKTI